MTGRGIDQILPHPSRPELHEDYMRDARDYVELAERSNGRIPRHADFSYVWGDALEELRRQAPDARIINLETSATGSDAWQDKGINYRMHPENVPFLTAAGVDVCALANNHVLDYERPGLSETLDVLRASGVRTAGAGRTRSEAWQPARLDLAGGQVVLTFSVGAESSGIPPSWAALDEAPGVAWLPDLSERTAAELVERRATYACGGALSIASIHWGSNWGYRVPPEHVAFAHRLIDGGFDIVHGHSSHHPRPIEVYRGKLILYGCGDFINDYEGISGYESFRGDLVLMYFVSADARTGRLVELGLTPMQLRRFRLNRATTTDADWLKTGLNEISADFGSRVFMSPDGALRLAWG